MFSRVLILSVILSLVIVPQLFAKDPLVTVKQHMGSYLASASEDGLTKQELSTFGDTVYSWPTDYYNAALHVIAWYLDKPEAPEYKPMVALGTYLQGKWHEDKWSRRRKRVGICLRGGFGVAKGAIKGMIVVGTIGTAVGGFGGGGVGGGIGLVIGAVVGHKKTWKRIRPEFRSTVRLKPSKVFDADENEELMALLERGLEFYEETNDLVTYAINEDAEQRSQELIDFEGFNLMND